MTRSGQIFVNGVEAQDALKELSGYVYQKDLFYERFTVSEHLNFVVSYNLCNSFDCEYKLFRITDLERDEAAYYTINACKHNMNGLEFTT